MIKFSAEQTCPGGFLLVSWPTVILPKPPAKFLISTFREFSKRGSPR
jgi:hypothetical protein